MILTDTEGKLESFTLWTAVIWLRVCALCDEETGTCAMSDSLSQGEYDFTGKGLDRKMQLLDKTNIYQPSMPDTMHPSYLPKQLWCWCLL